MSTVAKATITVGNTVITFEGPEEFVTAQVAKHMSITRPSNNEVHNSQTSRPAESKTTSRSGRTGRNLHAVRESESGRVPTTAPARILALKAEGFFSEPRTISQIRDELQARGWRYDLTALSGTLMKLVRPGKGLRRAKGKDGSKKGYAYFNP